MATESVEHGNYSDVANRIPIKRLSGETQGYMHDSSERIEQALIGLDAINDIMSVNRSCNEGEGWTDMFLERLYQGQQALVRFALENLAQMDREIWFTHALHGDYGEDARRKAEARLAPSDEAAS